MRQQPFRAEKPIKQDNALMQNFSRPRVHREATSRRL